MRRIAVILAILVIMLLPSLVPMRVYAAPVVVGSTTETYPIGLENTADKTFWCNGRHWAFWYDGTDIVWSTSSDNGVTWAAHDHAALAVYMASEFCVWCDSDNNSVHIAYSNSDAGGNPLYYRKGNCDAGGTITWADAVQTARAGVANHEYYGPTIITLSTGEPVIAYLDYTGAPGINWGTPYCVMSSTDNGTWTTAGGYPYQYATGSWYGAGLAPFSTGDFIMVAQSGTNATLSSKYNDIGGIGWTSQKTIGTLATGGNVAQYRCFDLVVQDDDIAHVVYSETISGHLMYSHYHIAAQTWAAVTELESTYNVNYSLSALSDNNMIVTTADQTADDVLYLAFVDGVWDTGWTVLANENSGTDSLYDDEICAPYNNYGTKWWVIYWRGNAGADDIMFEDIAPPTCTTIDAVEGVTKVTMYGTCNTTEGPEGANAGFNYGLTAAYGDNTTYQLLPIADNYSAYQTGLTASTTYHYRAEVRNSFGWDYGADKTFTTHASIEAPTNLIAIPVSATEIALAWEASDNAYGVQLEYSLTGYPTYGTGVVLATGVQNTFFMDNATGGTTYYFSVFDLEVDEPPSAPSTAMATTPAGYDDIDGATTGTTEPDTTALDASPIAGLLDYVETYGQLPRGTVGILGYLSILVFILMAVAIYNKSTIVVVVCAVAGLAIGHQLGLISFVFLVIAGIVGFAASTLRGGQPSG